jgi:hypothetical protein
MGYNETFCLKCEVGEQKESSQTFTFAQTSKCLTTLKTSKSKFKAQSFAFNPMESSKTIANNYETFFDNTDKVNCPVK